MNDGWQEPNEFIFDDIVRTVVMSRSDRKIWSFLLSVVVITSIIYLWASYVTQFMPINNLYGFSSCMIILLARAIISITHKAQEENIQNWQIVDNIVVNSAMIAVFFALLDLAFDTWFIPNLFGAIEFIDVLAITGAFILIPIIIMSVIRLILYSTVDFDIENKAVAKVTMLSIPLSTLGAALILLFFILLYNNPLLPSASMVDAKQEFGSLVPQGAYGGAEMFTYVFEMLFYNREAGMMLAIMTIAAIAQIAVINLDYNPAIKIVPLLAMVGIPMLMIISMMIGVIPPPKQFVEIFASEVLASFVYTFAEMCVYIIFVTIFNVFINVADIILPKQD